MFLAFLGFRKRWWVLVGGKVEDRVLSSEVWRFEVCRFACLKIYGRKLRRAGWMIEVTDR